MLGNLKRKSDSRILFYLGCTSCRFVNWRAFYSICQLLLLLYFIWITCYAWYIYIYIFKNQKILLFRSVNSYFLISISLSLARIWYKWFYYGLKQFYLFVGCFWTQVKVLWNTPFPFVWLSGAFLRSRFCDFSDFSDLHEVKVLCNAKSWEAGFFEKNSFLGFLGRNCSR